MIDKIILSQNKTKATIYFTDKPNFTIYSSKGQVELLLLDLTSPMNYNYISNNYSSIKEYISNNLSETIIINLNDIKER